MTGDQFAATLAGGLCLTLVGAGLLARRLPPAMLAKLAKLAAAWTAIIVGLAFGLKLFTDFT